MISICFKYKTFLKDVVNLFLFSYLMYFVDLAVSSAKQSLQMEVKGVYEECCQNRSASNSFIHVSKSWSACSFLLAHSWVHSCWLTFHMPLAESLAIIVIMIIFHDFYHFSSFNPVNVIGISTKQLLANLQQVQSPLLESSIEIHRDFNPEIYWLRRVR